MCSELSSSDRGPYAHLAQVTKIQAIERGRTVRAFDARERAIAEMKRSPSELHSVVLCGMVCGRSTWHEHGHIMVWYSMIQGVCAIEQGCGVASCCVERCNYGMFGIIFHPVRPCPRHCVSCSLEHFRQVVITR